jgi:hypothetical protein
MFGPFQATASQRSAGASTSSGSEDLRIAEQLLWNTLALKLHTNIGWVFIAAEAALQGARTTSTLPG